MAARLRDPQDPDSARWRSQHEAYTHQYRMWVREHGLLRGLLERHAILIPAAAAAIGTSVAISVAWPPLQILGGVLAVFGIFLLLYGLVETGWKIRRR